MDSIERADVHTLIGAYALDALDDDERAAFERHLAECEPCRDEVAGLRTIAVRLADAAAVPAPARMRGRVMQQISQTPQERDLSRETGAPAGRSRGGDRSRLWLAAAAVLAVICLGTGAIAWSQYRAAQDARATEQAIITVIADPAARVVVSPLIGGGTARLVVSADRAVLAGYAVPGLPQDRTYQLWIIRGKVITSGGLGPAGAAAAGTWSRLLDGVRAGDVVAISIEPRGGSRQPTTTPIAALKA